MVLWDTLGIFVIANSPSDIQLLGGLTFLAFGSLPLVIGSVTKSILKANNQRPSLSPPPSDPQPPPTSTE